MPDFLPRREADLLQWSSSFSEHVNSAPAEYAISPEMAAEYRALHVQFADLMLKSADATARTPSVLFAKQQTRERLVAMARTLTRQARGNMDVSNAQLQNLGLRARRERRGPRIQPPAEAPIVRMLSRENWSARFRLCDPGSMRVAKPAGAKSAILFMAVGPQPPPDRAAWTMCAITGRTVVDVKFPKHLPAGTQVWVAARWYSPTCTPGPPSLPCPVWIVGGAGKVA